MRTPESGKPRENFFDRSLGAVGVTITDMMFRGVSYINPENIGKIDRILAGGGSVLLASGDHPGTVETIYTAGLIPQYLGLRNREESAVVLRDGFVTGQMGLAGRAALDILDCHGIKPLDVMTRSYEPDEKKRAKYNLRSAKMGMEILAKPGGLLLIFASGHRSEKMLIAEEGLGWFSSNADWVVPLTTITDGNNRPAIVVHEPFPGEMGAQWCIKHYGRKNGRQALSDLVMGIAACGQPDEEIRGYYKEYAESLERYMRNPVGIAPQHPNQRIRRMVEVYVAWRSNQFLSP